MASLEIDHHNILRSSFTLKGNAIAKTYQDTKSLRQNLLLCRAKVFDNGHAAAINRFVFYLSAPALVFAVFAKAPLDNLSLTVLASYFGAEMVIYAGITLLARYGFGLDWAQSILPGMAAVFSNHVFFVLPIAVLAYGSDVSVTIGGVILVDAITFCLTVFLVEAASSTGSGLGNAAKGLLRNPFVYAPVLGALAWGLGDWMPSGVMTFAVFAGDAAAPVALFALVPRFA